MTLNASGPISLAGTTAGQSIEVEIGGNGTTQISLNDANVRALAEVPSGQISMPSNFYGKSWRKTVNLTISGNTNNYNIFNNRGGTYVAGRTDVIVTVNAGVVVGSTSTAAYAMDTGTGWTTGDTIRIVNNGYIVGQGGMGGDFLTGVTGKPGGPALRLQYATSITNNGTIGGGGGGGAGGQADTYYYYYGSPTIAGYGGSGATSVANATGVSWLAQPFYQRASGTAPVSNVAATITTGASAAKQVADPVVYPVGGGPGVSGGNSVSVSATCAYTNYAYRCNYYAGDCDAYGTYITFVWLESGTYYGMGPGNYACDTGLGTRTPAGGGGLGASGGSNDNGTTSTTVTTPGGVTLYTPNAYGAIAGGAGGAATNGAGTYATWLTTGTRYGTIG